MRKRKKPKRTQAERLAIAERIFELYMAGNTARAMHEETGVSLTRINRLLYEGDKHLHLEPLSVRRQRLLAEIVRRRDDTIIDRLVHLQEATATVAEAAALRTLGRIQQAHLLEDEEIYKEENYPQYRAAQAKALNPDAKDVKSLVEATAKLTTPDGRTPVNVSVSQSQSTDVAQQQISDPDGVDYVRQYMQSMQQQYGDDERRAIERVMCGASLLREKGDDAVSKSRGPLSAEKGFIAAVEAAIDHQDPEGEK